MERIKILERLQFIADSGWDIHKGSLAAETLIVGSNDINGDIEIAPVFDDWHNEIDMYFLGENRKNNSPIGNLNNLVQSPTQIRFNLTPYTLAERKNRKKGEYSGEYLVFRKKDPHSDHMEAVQKRGFRFEYDQRKRLFTLGKSKI